MKRFYESYVRNNTAFTLLSITCIAFLAAGFLFPPPGEIHNSVLIAVGEIIAIMALWTIIFAIGRGADAKLTKGDMTIEINNPNADDDGKSTDSEGNKTILRH